MTVKVSFARWGWGSDQSVESWMNQPDHSHPTKMKVQTFFSDLPLTFISFFPRLSHLSFSGVWH